MSYSLQKLKNDGLERVLQIIMDKLNSNASVSSGVLSMKGQVVFAVKAGLDGQFIIINNIFNIFSLLSGVLKTVYLEKLETCIRMACFSLEF